MSLFSMLGPEGFGTYEVDWSPRLTARRVRRAADTLLVPGFVDIHIHGAFGLDFMEGSAADLLKLADKLDGEGYEQFLPTTITADLDATRRALDKLPENHPMIPGFHLEGPFISPNYPGAQPPEAILDAPVVASPWDAVLDDPRLRLITLAPERPHALELINRLTNRGVVVSLGHTNATYDEARAAFEFGARHLTHTFNAMRPIHHREAGILAYAMMNSSMRCELIYDRIHVEKNAAALLLKSKTPRKVIAVSDSTAATGLPPGTELTMWGHACVVGEQSVRLKSNGALAGSGILLSDAFRNLAHDFGPEVAIRACCLNPRESMGWSAEPRKYLELNKEFRLVAQWEGGQRRPYVA
jgi:N-acetylglucosamine-6-phosphate deacetylase